MSKILFGTAGIPLSTKPRTTENAISQIPALKLSALELEFVYGVNLSPEKAQSLKPLIQKNKVSLSVHAPYYINLNSKEPEKIAASRTRIYQSAKIGFLAGAKKIVFHPAFMHNNTEQEIHKKVSTQIHKILDKMKENKINTTLAPETTGKPSQYGSINHLLKLHNEIPELGITIDASHLHARSIGKIKTKKHFSDIFSSLPKKLLNNLHLHASGIVYTQKGEKNHVTLESKENTFPYKLFLEALKDSKAKGTLICESPNLEKDALLMKAYYNSL